MTSTTFVDRSDPPIAAAWLNDVNNLVYNGVLPVGLNAAGTSLLPSLFITDARLDVQINRTTGEWIGFNTQDAFLSNGVLKAQYGLTLGVDSTLDPTNNSVHISGYGGLAFYGTGFPIATMRSAGTILYMPALGSSPTLQVRTPHEDNVHPGFTVWNGNPQLDQFGVIFNTFATKFGSIRAGGSTELLTGAGTTFISASTTAILTHIPFFPCDPNTSLNTTAAIYAGTGAPNNLAGLDGHYYFRSDTPGTGNQRIYVKSGGSWVGIV